MEDPREPTQQDRQLFTAIADDIRSNPHKYRGAGKWLDDYCSENAYWRGMETKVAGLKKSAAAGRRPPSPDVRHLQQKLDQREPPRLYNLFADTYHFLADKCKGQVAISEHDARRILLIIWLLTDDKAESFDADVTRLQKWPWESDTDKPGSRLMASKRWVQTNDYQRWVKLAQFAWETVAEQGARLGSENGERRSGRPVWKNLFRATIKHLPYVGPWLYDVIWGMGRESDSR